MENVLAELRAQAQQPVDKLGGRRAWRRYLAARQAEEADSSRATATARTAERFAEGQLARGIEMFHRGDLGDALAALRVAAGHEVDASAPYLAETYRRLGHTDLAAAWWTIAEAEGWIQAGSTFGIASSTRGSTPAHEHTSGLPQHEAP